MTHLPDSRRKFLKKITSATVLAQPVLGAFIQTSSDTDQGAPGAAQGPKLYDGPSSPLFSTVQIEGNQVLSDLKPPLVSDIMADSVKYAPSGNGIAWGIPFDIREKIVLIKDEPVTIPVKQFNANWIVFFHTSDRVIAEQNKDGFYEKPFTGSGRLNEHVANYVIIYNDGEEFRAEIRQRHQVGMFQVVKLGEYCTESQAFHKPVPVRAHHEQMNSDWGRSQSRTMAIDRGNWVYWTWALENPRPRKKISGFRFEPVKKDSIILSAISSGNVHSNPLRWQPRQKALMTLPVGITFDPSLDADGLYSQVKLDLGQVISASPQLMYPGSDWAGTVINLPPVISKNSILIEYTAHPEAHFHFLEDRLIPVAGIQHSPAGSYIKSIPPAEKAVRFRVVEKNSSKPVPVKLHIHGESGEYLPPVDRHRIPNTASFFEDYSVDLVFGNVHNCTYISGDTVIKLPVGNVFVEISKGFEIKPFRKVVSITDETDEVTIEIEKVIPWREKNWITADTHVHFLSPPTAQLEGSGEGVNIVNLLATQWGELMTNVGDFDGKTTFGSRGNGSDGEYLVRVGTENRQHILGHISLLGYNGNIITPLTTGGPAESAMGDPVEILLTEWAEQCKKQDGIVVIPHFPHPRLENAAVIVTGNADGVEVSRTDEVHSGINPFSLTDWYRYLNCGYFTAAVGGTDKMHARMPVGAIRTYARIDSDREFTYDDWKEAVKRGYTFVTCGPLMEFSVGGKPMGSKIEVASGGGTFDVTWETASVTMPMSRVELIVNGEIRESIEVSPGKGSGHWSVRIEKSSWIALLVRGFYYPGKPEIIAAHSSPVMINVSGSPMLVPADAVTILEQIEGALKHLVTIGTRADEVTYKRMRMKLESAYRTVHNRLHQAGKFHTHSGETDHSMESYTA